MTSALIIGRSRQVWYDVETAINKFDFDYVIAVNVAGCDYSGTIEHWVSYHPELFPMWLERRRAKGFEEPGQLWSSSYGRKRGSQLDHQLNLKLVDCEGGSSGKIAVMVALLIGCDRIVLAGVPLDSAAGQYDTTEDWDAVEVQAHREVWMREFHQLKPYVRSLSGWTREVFGYPDADWVEEGKFVQG